MAATASSTTGFWEIFDYHEGREGKMKTSGKTVKKTNSPRGSTGTSIRYWGFIQRPRNEHKVNGRVKL